METVEIMLRPLAPFRLDLTAWALRRRPVNIVDRFEEGVYSRVLVLEGRPVGVSVTQSGSSRRPELKLVARGDRLSGPVRVSIRDSVTHMLGLNVDLTGFYTVASKHPRLGKLAKRFEGMKPPRFPSIFEALVNSISCQQVSLHVGLLLVSRLSRVYGMKIDRGERERTSFATAKGIASSDEGELRAMGFSRQKSSYLLGLSRGVSSRRLELENASVLSDGEAMTYLTNLRGVGRWSAEYTMLRGMGRTWIFPGDDVGGQNGLRRWMAMRGKLDHEKVQRLLTRWRDYRGLIYFHLLLDSLERLGYVDSGA